MELFLSKKPSEVELHHLKKFLKKLSMEGIKLFEMLYSVGIL